MSYQSEMEKEKAASLLGFTYGALIEKFDKGGPNVNPAFKEINFTSTVDKDCTQAELDALIDKCRLAVERQRAFALVEVVSKNIIDQDELIKMDRENIDREDAEFAKRAEEHAGRAGRPLSQMEIKTRQENIIRFQNMIKDRDRNVAKLQDLKKFVGAEG